MAILCSDSLTLNEISSVIGTMRDYDNIIHSFLPEIAIMEYQENQVECVYSLKQELMPMVPIFVFCSNLSLINLLIDVNSMNPLSFQKINTNLKQKAYQIAPFSPCEYALSSFVHSFISSNTLLAFIYHSLQTQIQLGYTNMKFVEMLFYLIQVYPRVDQQYGKQRRPLHPCSSFFFFI